MAPSHDDAELPRCGGLSDPEDEKALVDEPSQAQPTNGEHGGPEDHGELEVEGQGEPRASNLRRQQVCHQRPEPALALGVMIHVQLRARAECETLRHAFAVHHWARPEIDVPADQECHNSEQRDDAVEPHAIQTHRACAVCVQGVAHVTLLAPVLAVRGALLAPCDSAWPTVLQLLVRDRGVAVQRAGATLASLHALEVAWLALHVLRPIWACFRTSIMLCCFDRRIAV
mmetsp:Transcript_496/g.1260  ORF Transcript_496/g.1260 Transcript_496/m.1260 type:complete len:229 (-) Transcript_496:420-1106(-)